MRYSSSVSSQPVAEPSERGERMSSGVPHGKRVLNTHISLEEHTFLKSMATKNSMTVTMFLRNLIRREMQRSSREIDVRPNY